MRNGLLFFLLVFFMACIDEINLDLPDDEVQQKVIEGYVERDENDYIFWGQASFTQHVTGEFNPGLLDAEISFRFNEGAEFSIPHRQVFRIAINSFHEQYGGDPSNVLFQLVVRVNGQKYISSQQRMISVPKPDSLSVQVVERPEVNAAGNITERTYVHLMVHTPLLNRFDESVSLSWLVTSAYEFREGTRMDPDYQVKTCYASNNIFQNDINISGKQDYPGKDRLSDFVIAETLSDFRFSTTYYFTVVQKSLSQESIDYWKEVKASNERSGNLYDVFPGRIRTNISNEDNNSEVVNGFFHVSEVDTMRLRVRGDMAGFPFPKCAAWVEPIIISADDPDPCLNCLKLSNSTLVRPPYWR